ncbi:MAG: MlaE family lipid ABC transporter permease subunit [Nitrospirae bacterium]|nr:MlaE family lipid ABC transporter permease subunit [Candidatus Manganitrophaceae bacterium]
MNDKGASTAEQAGLSLGVDQVIHVYGRWTLPHLADLERRIEAFPWPNRDAVVWEFGAVETLDTGGAWLLHRTLDALRQGGKQIVLRHLSPEHAELMQVVAASFATVPIAPFLPQPGPLERVGRLAWRGLGELRDAISFLGESLMTFLFALTHPKHFRWRTLLKRLELDGYNALPIVGLLLFLMGGVIAYQGATQLRLFGAQIFIVDLVGISLLREIAPLVTAIVVAGRSGAAYTAEIGTMKVTEELDAMRTIGIPPMELLVLPRIAAMVIALPLLTVFADGVGIFAGMLVAFDQLGVRFAEFISRFREAIALKHYLIGLSKAPVFALLISLTGCYQGFRVRGSVESVGRNTTTSVVQSIFLVIAFDAFYSIVVSWWNL